MLRFSSRLAVLICLLHLAQPVIARADDWQFRFLGQWVSTSAGIFSDLDDGPGVYLGVERRLNERWGVEGGLGWSRLEGSVTESFDIIGLRFVSHLDTEVEWLPVSVAGNFHLTPSANYDLYVAGRVGWAFFDDVRVNSSVEIDFGDLPFPSLPPSDSSSTLKFTADDAFFYGLRLGFDRAIGNGGWGVTAAVDWTALDLDYDPVSAFPPPIEAPVSSLTAELDPWSVGVGFFKRW